MTFRNNTSLSQEYLEDDLNVDFLEQTIKDLRDKSEQLPYVVEEGE